MEENEHAFDREVDAFEDAEETTQETPRPRTSSPHARSLTERTHTPSSTPADRTSMPPVPPIPNRPGMGKSIAARKAALESGPKKPEPPKEEVQEHEEAAPVKSPLLTGHRVSVDGMDDVSLEEGTEGDATSPQSSRTSGSFFPLKQPPQNSGGSQQGLSGGLPPPPAAPERTATVPHSQTQQPPAAPSRKLTSPFSWLSRNASSPDKKVSSPPLSGGMSSLFERRRQPSIATLNSNPDFMLSKIEDAEGEQSGSARARGNSLKDRFKMARMREEAGIDLEDGQPMSARTVPEEGAEETGGATEDTESSAAPALKRGASQPGLAKDATKQAVLPIETVPVDWDLWQSVVYEGPAAVARTSPEELNQAIAGGIPQAIRGVVWQVLAQSKNEDLEGVYRDLVVRGTDKEKQNLGKPPPMTRTDSSQHLNGQGKEKESVRSSASSVHSHSDYSTPATTETTNGHTSPLPTNGINGTNGVEAMKLQNQLAQETAKKAKDDAVALQKLEKTIKRDLGARTSYSKYVMAAGLQDGLFGVCKAYALFDQEVGYAQGMNFVAMPLLFNMPEEEAFCLLVRLMNKYGLRDMFIAEMPGLHLHLYQFERLLEDFEPALYCHLHRRGVTPTLYATQWFLTLFAYRFPLQLVLRIYDLILSDGLEGAILKFGILLMQKNAQTLLGMKDMSTLTTFLKERLFDVYIDKTPSANSLLESGFFGNAGGVDKDCYRADVLVQDACAIKITPQMLQTYTNEWKEKVKAEKDRETELETLRNSNASLTNRVRQLEERIEKSDEEHVAMASELVRTKVENQSLEDQNESFKVQTEELKRVVDSQGKEVEDRLKEEMETVMQRNIEVHNENRELKGELEESEKMLVETKMEYAQIQAEHEDLKRKWRNISDLMSKPS